MSASQNASSAERASHAVQVDHSAQSVCFHLQGDWTCGRVTASPDVLVAALPQHAVQRVAFDTSRLGAWDSTLVLATGALARVCEQRGISFAADTLPRGVQTLLDLARSSPSSAEDIPAESHGFVHRVGVETASLGTVVRGMIAFAGEMIVAFARFFRGKAQVRLVDIVELLRQCGADALPIVALVSLLVGVIFAFIGVVQLRQFGVDMYVADLVGIIMIRVMGAVMAAIVLAGRTGSAFAAQIGMMQAREEVDALKVLGVSPMEFLVVPRVLALTVMMPFLTIFAGALGVCGGMIIGIHALDLNMTEYINRTSAAVGVPDVLVGLVESVVFGLLVAMAGCYSGMRCARKASAVGDAATSAVVLGIVSIIVATSIITAITNVLGV
jgi:phospholipid/cholesterol/gamma-HCH transport system permease protein